MIRGGSDSAFEEAIFILRDSEGLGEDAFLEEAERLAADYVRPSPPARPAPGFWILAGITILSLGAWILYVLI